jgi:hypothetical protein
MMMSTMSRSPLMTCVTIAAILSFFILVFTFFQESLEVPWVYAHNKAEEYWDNAFSYPYVKIP